MVQYQAHLDRSFGALSDATRRAILLRHVRVLEEAGLVASKKVGRVRQVRLGPRRLDDVAKWITSYRTMLEQRLDHLEEFLERTKGTP